MLFVYDKNDKKIVTCKETTLISQNILERKDLEKWIEKNPEMLGEELLIISTEYDKFDKTNERLDLLSLDRDGNIVIIELKRDDSGKNVDLQAIKYAAYCSTLTLQDVIDTFYEYKNRKGDQITKEKAQQTILDFIKSEDFEEINEKPRIILLSREFRPEVTACVLWLRKFGVDITCIKLSPYELSDGNIALDLSILIPLPEAKEFMMKVEKKETMEYQHTVTQLEYINFYTDLVNLIRKKIERNYYKPSPRSYYQIPTGISGVHFEWGFHGRPRNSFAVELHFEKSDKDFNFKVLKSMEHLRNEIENATGEKVIYQEGWGKSWSRIYIEKQEGKFTDDLKKWAVEKMVLFINVLQPELDKLKEN